MRFCKRIFCITDRKECLKKTSILFLISLSWDGLLVDAAIQFYNRWTCSADAARFPRGLRSANRQIDFCLTASDTCSHLRGWDCRRHASENRLTFNLTKPTSLLIRLMQTCTGWGKSRNLFKVASHGTVSIVLGYSCKNAGSRFHQRINKESAWSGWEWLRECPNCAAALQMSHMCLFTVYFASFIMLLATNIMLTCIWLLFPKNKSRNAWGMSQILYPKHKQDIVSLP